MDYLNLRMREVPGYKRTLLQCLHREATTGSWRHRRLTLILLCTVGNTCINPLTGEPHPPLYLPGMWTITGLSIVPGAPPFLTATMAVSINLTITEVTG